MNNLAESATTEEEVSQTSTYQDLVLTNESLQIEVESWREKAIKLEAKVHYYEEQLRLAAAKKYGASSEKTHPEQLELFNEAEKESRPETPEPTIEEITYKRKRGGKRVATAEKYADLPVREIHYTLEESEQNCPRCQAQMKKISNQTRDEIVIIPATVEIHRHIQDIFACNNEACEAEHASTYITTARAPEPPIPHSPAGPSMIAHVMSRKYSEHVPLHRQEQQFSYYGISLPRQNMANWVIKGASLLEAVYDRLHSLMLQENYIHADESPMQVLSEPGKKATSKSYMWLYTTGRYRRRIYLYEYQPSRSGKHPKNFLSGFAGYLQTDAYTGYNAVENVKNMLCFAHAKREYTDALKALPKDADKSKTLCTEGVAYIDKLFGLERLFETMTPEQRRQKRLEQSKIILDEYHQWLTEKAKMALPQGKLASAVKYSLNHWDKLCIFLENGEIEISNNDCENGIRPFAVGRGNWLFAKSPNGAKASAIVYSIIETAKANGLAPFHYLKHLLERLPNMNITDQTALDALLPWSASLPDDVKPDLKLS